MNFKGKGGIYAPPLIEREVMSMLDKDFIKFLLIEGLCNGELEEDFQKDKNNLDKWVDMWYDEYTEKKER